ncbi:MAG: sodium ion-translocating decarboxylase subunit beta [Candidatus Cloacimonetes bacterium]|nr:sodium ion-translocating decarboxylase subunit beta [Candidatus Cloacimonadota bacterium]
MQEIFSDIAGFLETTGFTHIGFKGIVMILISFIFMYLAIKKKYEPFILLPLSFGMLLANMPGMKAMFQSVDSEGSVLNLLYMGVKYGIYPPLIFLGLGAMMDFTNLIANPRLIFIALGAQLGIFATFIVSQYLGFTIMEAASISIIGASDGPTTIFLTSKLAPHLLGTVALSAYSYMALVPIIQPPVVKLLTTDNERLIKMKPVRIVSQREKIIFPFVGFIASTLIAPGGAILLGMLFFGNLLRESGVTERLAQTARTSLIDICTVLVGFSVGTTTHADAFLRKESLTIFILGILAFMLSTASGVLTAKFMNLFTKEKINPIIGCAGVSANPMSARVAHNIGQQYDKSNYLLMHALSPNIAGVIASAVVAGVMLGMLY